MKANIESDSRVEKGDKGKSPSPSFITIYTPKKIHLVKCSVQIQQSSRSAKCEPGGKQLV